MYNDNYFGDFIEELTYRKCPYCGAEPISLIQPMTWLASKSLVFHLKVKCPECGVSVSNVVEVDQNCPFNKIITEMKETIYKWNEDMEKKQ